MDYSFITDMIVGYAVRIGLIAIAIFIVLVLLKSAFNKTKGNKKENNKNNGFNSVNDIFPYKNKNILTKNEYIFWRELRKYTDKENLLICPKVGLKDLFEITQKENYLKYFGKISQKHVDFVICDNNLRLQYVIELDDSSHEKEKTKENDLFKNKLFEITGIRLIRIKAQKEYSDEQIKRLIEGNENITIKKEEI